MGHALRLPALLRLALAATLLPVLGLAGACEADRAVVSVLVADAADPEPADLRAFRDHVRHRCDGCVVEVAAADGDADRQAEQLRDALAAGADVVVLQAVDPEAAEALVGRTGEVPLVTWGAAVAGADLHVGVPPDEVGRLLGRHAARTHGEDARVLLLAAPPDDERAAAVAAAARSELADARVEDVTGADDAAATEAALGDRLARSSYDVVLAVTAEQADGAAAALDAVARPPALLGPEASLEAARRLVTGDQAMAVHQPDLQAAEQVADVVVPLLTGGEPHGGAEHEGVRSWLLAPEPVTLTTLTDTLVRDGAVTLEDLCAGTLQERCRRLGFR